MNKGSTAKRVAMCLVDRMRIEKKIPPDFFQKVASGEKNFEVRFADFKCKPGDVIVFKEYDVRKKKLHGKERGKKSDIRY